MNCFPVRHHEIKVSLGNLHVSIVPLGVKVLLHFKDFVSEESQLAEQLLEVIFSVLALLNEASAEELQ